MKLKRKKKKVQESVIRELTVEERERVIKNRLSSVSEGYIRKQILKTYDEEGRSKAISVAKKLISTGGMGSGGLLIMGRSNGILVKIHKKGASYVENDGLIAEGLIPYSEVVDFALSERENAIQVKNSSGGDVMGAPKNELKLLTGNNDGLYQTEIVKGKEKRTLAWENCKIVIPRINKLVTNDVRPKFQDWSYHDYLREFKATGFVRFLEPMGAKEDEKYLDPEYPITNSIAELKKDGHRALLFMGNESNRVFSRVVSKKTDWFTENTDTVPHIRDMILPDYAGTVLDGEFDYGKTSKEVQSVLGSLPARAIQYQYENGFIDFFAFDILYYKGINVQALPLWKRKVLLSEVVMNFLNAWEYDSIKLLPMYLNEVGMIEPKWESYAETESIYSFLKGHVNYVDNFGDLFLNVVEDGQEGLIVKDLFARYEQKRSKSYIKLKKKSTWDCFIVGLEPPTKEYSGKELETWGYWESPNGELIEDKNVRNGVHETYLNKGYIPVTKPYFMGWCGGIKFAVWRPLSTAEYGELEPYIEQGLDDGSMIYYKDEIYIYEEVGVCKGLTEETMEDLKNNYQKYVEEKRVLEILAQEVIDKDKGSLRHPRFLQWRDDKSHEMCDWYSHIREERKEKRSGRSNVG